MHRADRQLPRWRLAVGLVLVAAIMFGLAPKASAEPTNEERRKAAEEVAATVCRTVPAIPTLPSKVDLQELCRSVVVENVDPDGSNAGVYAACQAALPLAGKLAARPCADVLDKLLDPARRLFLDKVVPAVQQLACVTSSPAAFDCLAQQVHVWLKQSIMSLWQGLITVLTSDTKVIDLVDGWRNRGIVSLYQDVGSLSATVLLLVVLIALIVSIVLFDFRRLGGVLAGLISWGIFVVSGATIAVMLVKGSDAAARWLAGRPGRDGETDLTRAGREFANWVDYVTATGGTMGGVGPIYDPGSLTAIVICVLLIVAIIVALFALLMRTVALLLLIVTLPLTLAGAAGPRVTRQWLSTALRLFVAMLFAKPLIVIAIRLGAVLVSVPRAGEPQATFSDALLGIALILIAGLLPGVIYRYSGGLMQTQAGAAPRASGGVSEQAGQSTQTTFDMTRMIMERNAPRPLSAVPSTGSAAARPAPTAAGSSLAGSLGGVAGAVSAGAAAAALVGGAAESGGRWIAGQAATAGGVFGDVEAPRVPSAPISRLGHLPAATAKPAPANAGADGPAATVGQGRVPVQIVVTTPTPAGQPSLPAPSAPLIIPGSAAEEPRQRPELRAARKALPPGTGEGVSS